jgi:hypothetical protein
VQILCIHSFVVFATGLCSARTRSTASSAARDSPALKALRAVSGAPVELVGIALPIVGSEAALVNGVVFPVDGGARAWWRRLGWETTATR